MKKLINKTLPKEYIKNLDAAEKAIREQRENDATWKYTTYTPKTLRTARFQMRFWGVYFPAKKAWMKDMYGSILSYPHPGIADAMRETFGDDAGKCEVREFMVPSSKTKSKRRHSPQ